MNAVAAELPLWAVTPEKVQTAVERIVAAVQPVRIIAFGSRARGEARMDSDLDLLVILSRGNSCARANAKLDGLLDDLILAVDLIVADEDRFEERSTWINSLYHDAAREGLDLYRHGTANPHAAQQVSR